MPLLSQPVTELTQHIFNPVINQIVNRLVSLLGYTDVIGDQIYINTDWSTHTRTSSLSNNVLLGQQTFRCDAHLQMNPTSQKFDFYSFQHTTAYGISNNTLNDSMPVYWDAENRVRIIEMRSPVTIVLNCELQINSAELAFQTPAQLFNSYDNGAVIRFNDLAYDYPIPKPILSVLYGMWKIDRIKGRPANKTFREYIAGHTGERWQYHKHREKTEYELVVPVYDLMTLGTLEYSDDRPQGVMDGKLPISYTIPFIYTIQFAIPTLNILQYPPVCNNQLLPNRLIPQSSVERFNNMAEYRGDTAWQNYSSTFERKPQRYIQMPHYDEWVVPSASPARASSQMPVVIAALLIDDETTLKTEVDFSGDLDTTVTLQDYVKEILYQQGEASVESDCIYNVALYKEDRQLVPYSDYTFNEDLKLNFTASDLYSHYHVVVSSISDLSKLNPKWYDLLKKFYPFLNPSLKKQIKDMIDSGKWGKFPNGSYLDDNGNIRDKDGNIISKLTDTTGGHGDYFSARIFRYGIIANETGKSPTGAAG